MATTGSADEGMVVTQTTTISVQQRRLFFWHFFSECVIFATHSLTDDALSTGKKKKKSKLTAVM